MATAGVKLKVFVTVVVIVITLCSIEYTLMRTAFITQEIRMFGVPRTLGGNFKALQRGQLTSAKLGLVQEGNWSTSLQRGQLTSAKLGLVLEGNWSTSLQRGQLTSAKLGLVLEGNWSRSRVCETPKGNFKAWRRGLVTSVKPELGVERNCSRLIAGDADQNNTDNLVLAQKKWKSELSYEDLLQRTSNCSWLVESFEDNLYNTVLERKFPLAFSFVVYESPEQFLRLLRLLYRPQNIYCIHADGKSKVREAFVNIAKCFPNIFLPRQTISVSWSRPTLLMSQMSCLSDLVEVRDEQAEEDKWQYVVNLCGKELPLTSNVEMVKKMVRLNGTSSMQSRAIPSTEKRTLSRLKGKTLPYNLTYYKGRAYMALSAQFARHLVRDPTAQSIYQFFLTTDIAEEHFYATMFRMPGVPGGYDAKFKAYSDYFGVANCFWANSESDKSSCHGKVVHNICVVSFRELPRILKDTRNSLFHNKYFMELDHLAMDCMEERIVATNKREFEQECSGVAIPQPVT